MTYGGPDKGICANEVKPPATLYAVWLNLCYFSLTITDLRKDGFTATIEYDDETEEQEFTIEEGIQTHLN